MSVSLDSGYLLGFWNFFRYLLSKLTPKNNNQTFI